ncbi:hypothetical protein MKZ38_000936 [Zalerion maritima]|uniref:Uncharacterized protein n=1 Tax=Zalerion maritima TaxID=339359 RepID=A0AAD5RSC2_9PEZI|nr:hypothetical protein MKZ38_000936 [Zalerion maritima]
MEGTLLVPPDRGTIIGRAVWKPRYMVIGASKRDVQSPSYPGSQMSSSSRLNASRIASPRSPPSFSLEPLCMSIYKAKFAITSITECSVQLLAHRKQAPHLPTLVINISPNPATDKLRKRRSSRTAGLGTIKENHPNSLWFRAPSESHPTLHEWARFIQPMMQQHGHIMSPISPNSPSFVNPFAGMHSSGGPGSRSTLQHKSSANTYSSRERPLTFSSESPSLRSKRSDISSHASSANHAGFTVVTGQHYTVGPDNLPSPATTIGEYTGDFIEGWTTAQGRPSAVSSPIRGRDSLGSQPQVPVPATGNASSPPGPRETILDRAFQMRVIPGSTSDMPGEEKLSSLARFDALMKEAEQKRLKREAEEKAKARAQATAQDESEGLKSAWDLDESSDEEDEDEENATHGHDADEDDAVIGPKAQRALEFIADRHNNPGIRTGPPYSRSTISYHPDTLRALASSESRRPHTGYGKNRPVISQRTNSQPQMPGEAPNSPASTVRAADDYRNGEKRQSISSAKGLSFNDFTKRLSSTSSLLLVQTNVSGGSSQRSSEIEAQQPGPVPRGRTPGPPPPGPRRNDPEWDNSMRCGWRGSIGVFGGEGGFL